MAGYQHTLLLHVLVAIVGVGSIAAMAILAIGSPLSEHTRAAINGLRRVGGLGLGLMLLTGLYLLHVTGWGYLGAPWFWISFGLYVALGPLLGQMIRVMDSASAEDSSAAKKVRLFAWAILVFLILIAFLMYVKP